MSVSALRVVSFLVLVSFLSACRQEEPAPPSTGIVVANQAYLDAFGSPPEVQAGKAYARVGYLPVRGAPATVGAIPLYIYEEHDQLPRILQRLLSDDLVLPPASRLYKPFPPDARLQVIAHRQGGLELALDFTPEASMDLRPMLLALAETALQYDDVSRVRILVNGEPPPGMPEGGWGHDEKRLAEVAPPALVLVGGTWDEGATDPEEIMVNFDRPVTVNSFRLAHADGRKVAGEYFTSVFQMSVIVHPEQPELFREGMELEVAWEVVDALGRTGAGRQVVPMERFEHPAHLGEFEKK